MDLNILLVQEEQGRQDAELHTEQHNTKTAGLRWPYLQAPLDPSLLPHVVLTNTDSSMLK